MKNINIYAFADEASSQIDNQIIAMQRNGLSGLEIRGVDGENVSSISLEKAKEVKKKMDDAGLRIMLSAAVIICCSYAGKAVSSRNTRRMKLLANIMDAMQMLRIHMLDNLLPLSAALEKSECILFKNISHALSE